jgi:acetylornithine/succinyldiaminopimelate/putrescine aminotransferase
VLNTGAGHEPALLEVYAHMPVRPVMGAGSWLVDENGERWLDAYGGHAVSSTGHSHPMVVAAIAEQAARLLFYSSAVPLAVREELAEALVARAPRPLDRVFFCNSGAEANENALHLARRWTGRQDVVTVTGGWHGRTVATLACCDGERYEAGAARAGMPLSRRARFNDVDDLRRVVGAGAAAVLLEPVQGMSGARTATREFLEAAREVCDATRTALVFDEVQCGVGRCGAFTAAEATGVTPDIITMAKGLGSGLPGWPCGTGPIRPSTSRTFGFRCLPSPVTRTR